MLTDLFQAARRNGSSAVTTLAGAPDINVRTEEGQNLLHTAIAYGNQSVVGELLKLRIDVNAQDSKGQSPLHYAATYQNVDAVEQILSNGGDLSLVDAHGNHRPSRLLQAKWIRFRHSSSGRSSRCGRRIPHISRSIGVPAQYFIGRPIGVMTSLA